MSFLAVLHERGDFSNTYRPGGGKIRGQRRSSFAGGVYILTCDDEVIYVGQTSQFRLRLESHRRKGFTRALFLQTNDGTRCSIAERFLIRHFRPKFNVLIPNAPLATAKEIARALGIRPEELPQ